MKKIGILGSTGSIGTQALNVIEDNTDKYSVSFLSCKSNIELLCKQIEKFNPNTVVVATDKQAKAISEKYGKNLNVLYGDRGLNEAACHCDQDMVLNSLVGIKGLEPTYKAILSGKDIALANKETLVTGGEIVMKAAARNGVNLLPVDSEHSAIFQSLMGNKENKIRRILLTASGGPFRGKSLKELENVTVEQALNHPNWSMGSKITIDSATMMNKGLEVIEAKWLFDVELDKIQILVHPQSIMHSGVEYEDGAVIAQLGTPDMRIPIALAFSYPSRLESSADRLDFFKEGRNLTFEEVDWNVFKCVKLAYQASKQGGSYPVVLNGANEVLVENFLKGKIGFLDIQNIIEEVLDQHNPIYKLDLETILMVDKNIRGIVEKKIKKIF